MSPRDLTILGCSSQQPTRKRNHGAYLLRWNGEGLLFDPGEGTQRQFIFANVAPTVVTRIFVSHFHGDHCLGLGSMLMRLNLDKVTHPIHCYYPASGAKYFHRLRFGTIYHENINVIEHPVSEEGVVEEGGQFKIEALYLDHGVDNLAWRITEAPRRKFDAQKLESYGIRGPLVSQLQAEGKIFVQNAWVSLEEVSHQQPGDAFAFVSDTRFCQNAIEIARNVELLLCESTYLEEHQHLAVKNHHLTAREAATIAKEAQAKKLILTHFSARYNDLSAFQKEAKTIFPDVECADDLKVFQFPKGC